jgi:uncharacterized iron-regulated protein
MKTLTGFLFLFCFLSPPAHAVGTVLILGESHAEDRKRDELARELGSYAQQGYRYLAMEMFKDNRQSTLDLFNRSPDDHEHEVLDLLTKEWSYNSRSYLDLMKEAHRQGMAIIALDLPKNELPQEVAPFPVPPRNSLQMDARNVRMAQNISLLIQRDPGAGILVLVGSFHAKPYAIPQYLTRLGHFFQIKSELDASIH